MSPARTDEIFAGLRGALIRKPSILARDEDPVSQALVKVGEADNFKVRLHPDDNGDYLDQVFLQDPLTFVPPKNEFGEVHAWGVYSYDEQGGPDVNGERTFMRQMASQFHYTPSSTPEVQFIKALMRRKEQKLKWLDVSELKQRDYIIGITLQFVPVDPIPKDNFYETYKKRRLGEELIYRRFRVSGGVKLDALQDKVIQPIMGWTRNAHAYTFTDFTDGACYGPEDCNGIDMQHINRTCYAYLPADHYTLAHLVQDEGRRFSYYYDFGDRFFHMCEVEKILPVSESNGAVEVLGGRGMCPADDCGGYASWSDILFKYMHGSNSERNEAISSVFRATNYRDKPVRFFDPAYFSIQETQEAVADALASPASVRTGQLIRTMPFSQEGIDNPPFYAKLKKGQKIDKKFDEDGWGYEAQVVTERKDSKSVALCAVCGSPNGLRVCSQCGKVYYCSKGHQKQNWANHRAECQVRKPR